MELLSLEHQTDTGQGYDFPVAKLIIVYLFIVSKTKRYETKVEIRER